MRTLGDTYDGYVCLCGCGSTFGVVHQEEPRSLLQAKGDRFGLAKVNRFGEFDSERGACDVGNFQPARIERSPKSTCAGPIRANCQFAIHALRHNAAVVHPFEQGQLADPGEPDQRPRIGNERRHKAVRSSPSSSAGE